MTIKVLSLSVERARYGAMRWVVLLQIFQLSPQSIHIPWNLSLHRDRTLVNLVGAGFVCEL